MEIMEEIFKYLSHRFKEGTNSNKTGSMMHQLIKEKTGCRDPYYNEKIEGNEIALKYLPDVKEILKKDDSLENHVKIAIIGNILDFGAFTLDDDIESVIKSSLKKDLVIKSNLLLDKESVYQFFPPYWYERGCAFMDLFENTQNKDYLSKAWISFDRYEQMSNKFRLYRYDSNLGMIALYKLHYMNDLSEVQNLS